MGFRVDRTLAIPLSAIALFAVALTGPAGATLSLMTPTTVLVVTAVGITTIAFLMPGVIPFLRASRSLVHVRPSGHRDQASKGIAMAGGMCARTLEAPDRRAVDDALDLVRMDDDGGWQIARPPA